MVDITIDANGFGSFYENVGNNGTDDTVTVNIGPNFSGTVTVDSQPSDGEYDDTIVNLPPGWKLVVINLSEDGSTEDPSFKDFSYEVFDADGNSVGTLSIRSNNIQGAPCFTSGTLILAENGDIPVEDLSVGDLIFTRDNGLQTVRWKGHRSIDLSAQPHLRPIRITAGALGSGVPSSDLMVSPQHRIFVSSGIAQRMFGAREILVAAKQLIAIDGIELASEMNAVTYFHILLDRHEIVLSNGAETESLYVGIEALRSLGTNARKEILEIFPELSDRLAQPDFARPVATGRLGRKLAARHAQNGRALVS
ncbi:Hint domain-containing protein [Paracoccus aminophilus]|nr:Hint domain-containing protein [Paracoccus aminophilus]